MNLHENKLVRMSIITLLLSLLIVYLLLWQIKGSDLKNPKPIITQNTGNIVVTQNTGLYADTGVEDIEDELTGLEENNLFKLESTNTSISNISNTTSNIAVNTGTTSKSTDSSINGITVLSGTKLYYGKIDGIEKLGIKYQYSLIDDKGIFYINLGKNNYDIDSIARSLKGSTYKITTEQELEKNKLVGDTVTYINLPTYQNKTVLMLVYINNQNWLLQIDYVLYHKSKSYIKSLFIE